MQTEMLIGSKFETGTETEEPILNPKTGDTILDLPEASQSQIDAAVAAAEKAFATWSRTTPAQRSGYLLKIADRIEAEAREFAALEALNCGKPINAVLNDEIPAIVDCYRFFAGAVRSMPGQVAGEYLPGHTSMIRRDPIGIVASIAPWNYPLMMMAWKLAPAIAGGNTVVFKPSEQTPLTALKMAKVLSEILPEGVVNVVLGRGDSVGNALINHPKINMISITGDVATGKKVLQAAAKSVKRTHLELGGKAPVIVFDDADIDAVVNGLRAFGYYNAGQDCTAACRIYAGKKVYDKLVADLSSAVSTIKYAQSRRHRERDRPADLQAPARPRRELRRARVGAEAHRDHDRRQARRRQGLLLPADGGRRRPAGRRDRAPRGVRPGRLGHALLAMSTRRSTGPTTATTASPPRCGPRTSAARDGDRRAAAIWLHLDQHALHAGQRDAAWRAEAVRLRQGHVALCAGGLHRRAPRDDRARLIARPINPGGSRSCYAAISS